MTRPTVLIDPPSPFAPISEWEDFLREAEKMDQSDTAVAEAVKEAKRILNRD